MVSTLNKVHKVLVSFPQPLYDVLLYRSQKLGMSYSEYIRYIVFDHLSRPDFFSYIQNKIKLEKELESVI